VDTTLPAPGAALAVAAPALVANKKPGKQPGPTFPIHSSEDRAQIDINLVNKTVQQLQATDLVSDPWRLQDCGGCPVFVRSGGACTAQWMQLPPPAQEEIKEAGGPTHSWTPMYVCATDLHTAHRAPLDTYIPAAQVLCSNLHMLYQPQHGAPAQTTQASDHREHPADI
jgi:hypothetical protein